MGLGSLWLVLALLKVTSSSPTGGTRLILGLTLCAIAVESYAGLALLFLPGRTSAWIAVLLPIGLLAYGVLAEGWLKLSNCGCFGPSRGSFGLRMTLLGVTLAGAGVVAHAYEARYRGSSREPS